MTDPSFTTTFTVDQTPRQAFDAISNVRGWWSEQVDGGTANAGDEFTYRYRDVHHCTMRVTEAIPGRKISWLVLENYFDEVEDTTEWVGTTIHFEITEDDGRTQVTFTHRGLVPEYECFENCSTAWSFYVNSSLRDLITTGKGQPNDKEVSATQAG
ncbi:SRPBCC domain-containing protein [Kribbella sancticallisti]|uniref:SRPBCC domain-containing protein n=1 Tax=Kribbella sancticallisti TaxID=460087 RepID=A0ABN2EDF6_9ACTN